MLKALGTNFLSGKKKQVYRKMDLLKIPDMEMSTNCHYRNQLIDQDEWRAHNQDILAGKIYAGSVVNNKKISVTYLDRLSHLSVLFCQ